MMPGFNGPPRPDDIAVTNRTACTIYVGSQAIPPGETRVLPAHHVPPHLRPTPAEPVAAAPDPMLTLLDGNVQSVIEAVTTRDERGAPILFDTDLDRIEAAETAGKRRKGVIEAIAEERLRRAAERVEDDRDESADEGAGD